MSYLAVTPAEARAQVRALARQDHFIFFYGVLALLALVPSIGSSMELRGTSAQCKMAYVWASFVTSVLLSLPLFFYALDWGRWIYIHDMSLALLLLFASGQPNASIVEPRRIGPVAAVSLVIYASAWTLPDTGGVNAEQRFGYIDVVRDVSIRLHRHV